MRPSHALSALLSGCARTAQLDEALFERELLCRSVLTGTEDAVRDLPNPSLRHAWGITPDDGDDEHPRASA